MKTLLLLTALFLAGCSSAALQRPEDYGTGSIKDYRSNPCRGGDVTLHLPEYEYPYKQFCTLPLGEHRKYEEGTIERIGGNVLYYRAQWAPYDYSIDCETKRQKTIKMPGYEACVRNKHQEGFAVEHVSSGWCSFSGSLVTLCAENYPNIE